LEHHFKEKTINKNKHTDPEPHFTEYDTYLFKQGEHFYLFDKLGSHPVRLDGVEGTAFSVWAPNAERVSVIGDFNGWDPNGHPLKGRQDQSGIWEGFIGNIGSGTLYKYHLISKHRSYKVDKGDPFAPYWEKPPKTASLVWDLHYQWEDQAWMNSRSHTNGLNSPMAIYEVHLGSWKRVPEEENRPLSYREMAPVLSSYVKEMGFTHVELLPITEHPFYGSWGYQTTGYFAPTSRYGTPQDLMFLVDTLHQNGIGVILDWVPSHFPSDEHGLAFFDGTHLFEHADPRKGFHPEWNSYIFNYGRNEVRAFLISNALFWLKYFHMDGLRVDGVASMLYLDYARKEGEWIPNEQGGNENLEAVHFLKRLNEVVYANFPDVQTIAEESTAWPMVSRPTDVGGLGFGMKWNMGWMHDTLKYFSKDAIYRKHHHHELTHSISYAFSENYILALSHDEVVHGKGSLIGKMPGDDWQRFANLRLLLGYMYSHPGKKHIFMGGEFGQIPEWRHEESLEWHLLQYPDHLGVQKWTRDLNHLYQREPALYEMDFVEEGFQWMDLKDVEQSIISFTRQGRTSPGRILIICNFTPIPRENYRLGIDQAGFWREVLNSDAKIYGGSGMGNFGGVETTPKGFHGRDHSLILNIPPLGIIFLKNDTQ